MYLHSRVVYTLQQIYCTTEHTYICKLSLFHSDFQRIYVYMYICTNSFIYTYVYMMCSTKHSVSDYSQADSMHYSITTVPSPTASTIPLMRQIGFDGL